MIADNSAYSEQLIQDVVQSAFNSAGQRCSSLRVLFLPQETADTIIRRIIQVMQLLIIDDPEHIATDMGPLINPEAVKQLNQHVSAMQKQAKVLCQITLAG
ncbi:MAG TPA: aldehyde dehydrogenase family protein, partial [Methylococcaceae bacterium]|nr:aldehyde dehydrogenase family protein [Methylococcaceae bacterium]